MAKSIGPSCVRNSAPWSNSRRHIADGCTGSAGGMDHSAGAVRHYGVFCLGRSGDAIGT